MTTPSNEKPKGQPRSLSGLLPFLKPYRGRIALAGLFLVLAAVATLIFPVALRGLIDGGLTSGATDADKGASLLALRGHFFELFAVATALGLFSAARFYMVSWLGERVTADLRNAVYGHVLHQSPEFFETTQTGEVLSRLTADTTLVQSVVGSSLSMGLRNGVMGIGALAMLVWTNPYVMTQVLGVLVLIVLPSVWFGRRVRKLSRASQDRMADSSAIAAEVLNAIPVVQSYTAEARESARFDASTQNAFMTANRRNKTRSVLVAFIIIATSAALLWGLYQGTQAVMQGKISAGHLGQTVVYVIILASAFAVLGEVYGDLLRAAGATERLMELLHAPSHIISKQNKALASENIAGPAIELVAINFHYPSRPSQLALHDFSLQVMPGETVALVGESGAGKTTVFQLLQRFYDPQQGQIMLSGTALADLALPALRGAIAVVPQDGVVFSSTAMENIRYGRPGATDAEVYGRQRRLCRRVLKQAARRLQHLPGRARRAPVRRAAPAHRHCPRHPEKRAHSAAGRSHQRAGRAKRAHGASRPGARHARPHHPRHRPPPGHSAASRPHRSDGARPHRRGRQTRRPGATRRRVRTAGGAAVYELMGVLTRTCKI